MNRRTFLRGLTVGALYAPLAVLAQPAERVYRIGILGDKASDSSESHRWQTFRAGLRDRGWNEGVNIRIEYRWVEANAAQLPELAADLVRLKPDLIATYGSFFTRGPESSDILDPHRLHRPCRSSRDGPRHEPRQTRRKHHRNGRASDGARP